MLSHADSPSRYTGTTTSTCEGEPVKQAKTECINIIDSKFRAALLFVVINTMHI